MSYTIPINPISVNKVWQGRRFKTKEYKEWREDVGLLLINNKIWVPEDYMEAELHFYIKEFKRSDTDNFVKPALDALQEHGVLQNDNKIVKFSAEKHPVKDKRDEKITISFKEYEYG